MDRKTPTYLIPTNRLKFGRVSTEYKRVFFVQLTPEEHKKVEKRKEQNRLAARRFRQKRQEKNWTLVCVSKKL